MPAKSKRYEWRVIDQDDLPAMREWTEAICRGCTVPQLAESFEVRATRTAVYAFLTRGVGCPATRRVVRETCKRELDKTEGRGSVEPPLSPDDLAVR
jgi:hypothetical protein